MGLSADLLSEFSKVTKDSSDKKNKESTLFGTAVEYNGKMYVKLDGSELLTPVSTTAVIESGERVTVLLKNHNATVTGNLSSPSVRKGTVDALDGEVKELGTQITEFEIVIADKVSTQELEAEKARIDELVSENVVIRGTLTANEADISDLKADNVTINETLVANQADIESLQTTKLDAEIADITYATIADLDVTNADIHNLDADFGDFKVLTAENFSALDATIKELDAQKLSATEAEIKYANIDFSNIGKAAMENLYANSGLIRDVIVDNGTITGHLVGVTISGDLIEGNTIIAEKLVIKGDDGLYYKLNTDGVTTEAEQTDYNSLNGSVIKAKSITATKVSVEDLVAFDATIGGFKITDSAIYSGVKETADNSTRGIYLDKTGQIAIGDSTNYLKYYKDQNGVYKLEISAGSIKLSSSNKTVETALSEMIVSSVEEFYQSSSPSSLSGGSWSASQPAWVDGTYIWRRTKVTYGDGHSDYSPSTTGVCITGNTGAEGPQGESGVNGVGVSSVDVQYYKSTSSTSLTGGSWQTTNPGWENGKYIWSKTVITYTDSSTDESSPVCLTGSTGSTGASGSDGSDGNDGVGISTIVEQYYQSSSSSNLSGGSWSNSYPGWVDGKYIWTRSVITYTNGKTTTTSAVCVTGSKGATGDAGNGISKTEVYYYLSTSSTAQSGGSWSTTVPEWVDGRYYWQKIKTTYTNGSTSESTPVCITGAKGATGATGSTGTGVESITTEFYLSSSKTTQTGGSWSTTMPIWSSGMYLWTRNKVVYKNPSSTVYTTPICDSSWEAVNEIQIGGRNLIRGTKNFKIDDTQTVGWKNTDSWSLETDDEGFTVVSKSQTDQTSNNIPSIYSSRFPVSLGDVLIYSCWFKVDDVDVWDGLKSPYIFEGYDSSNTRVQYQDVSVFVTNSNRPTVTSGEWVYFYSTHTITDESVVKAGMRLTLFRNGSIHIKKCKVEKGNKPTDWTPAPEDVEQDINDTANDIYQEISDQSTNIISDCEAIILEATKNYTKTSDFDSFKETVNSQLTLLADELTAKFTKTTEDIENVNGDLQEKFNTITKYFTFDINGLTIGQEDNPNKVVIDNDEISILVNGSTVQKFDANGNALIPDLKVTTSLNLFGYSITQDSSGNVNCAYVGGE